ncbi:hypothetical protein HOF65_04565 [bacterium]|nr:hypothetical protein [bacterium]
MFLAEIIADSLIRLPKSAPANQTVFDARDLKSIVFATFLVLACIFKIASLSCKLGRLTVIFLSNLPGLSNALSKTSALFVAHITITFVSLSKPSISVNI